MSVKSRIDTNIDHYDEAELLDIIGLDDLATNENINARVEKIINKYSLENNTRYVQFFMKVKDKLLADEVKPEKTSTTDPLDQAEYWYKNQYLLPPNQNQANKITHRHDSTQIFGSGTHYTMKKETLGINNTVPLSVVQDSLNPVLRQIIWRHITIDSQYRPNTIPYVHDINAPTGAEANFICSLSETLKNVLSIKLKSLHVPTTWYTFDSHIGNTCFYILYLPGSISYPPDTSWNATDASCCALCITEGNYATTELLVDEINHNIYNKDISACCTSDLSGLHLFIQNHRIQDKILQFLNLTSYWIKILFYDPNFDNYNCGGCFPINLDCTIPSTYKQNLGYYLGFRIQESNKYTLDITIPPINMLPVGPGPNPLPNLQAQYFAYLTAGNDISLNIIGEQIITALYNAGTGPGYQWPEAYYKSAAPSAGLIGSAPTPPDLIGSQYLLFILEDFTQNFSNNGLVSIGVPETKLSMPVYANKVGYGGASDVSANITDVRACDFSFNPPRVQIIPSFPRKLTQAQIYSLNQIINNRQQDNTMLHSPNPPDLFATINLSLEDKAAIIYNADDTVFDRKYFGPVTLERLGIKLLDDKGNIVNLHGHNWSFTLAVEQLYQY